MPRHTLLSATFITAATTLATTASAEISGADVWASYTSYYEATGASVFGYPRENGDTLTIAEPALLYRLPFNIATLRIGLPDMDLTTQSDGTVSLSYPDAFDIIVEIDVPDEFSGTGTLAVTQTGFRGVASGTPGDVTFVQSAESMTLELSDLSQPQDEVDLRVLAGIDGYAITSRVTEGDLITVTNDMTFEPANVAYVFTDNSGLVVSNTGTFGRNSGTSQLALPAGGSNLFDLSSALKDGAYIRGTSDAAGNTSETVTTMDGDIVSQQITSAGQTNAAFSLDANGVDLFAEVADNVFSMTMPEVVPFAIEGAIKAATMGYKFPLLPSEEDQDVGLRFDLQDLTLSEELWALFDPAGELPRDPATIRMDLAGTVLTEIDWLNFAGLEAQFDQPVPPIAPTSVTINSLMVSAVGASAQGSGSFTLDMSDMETIPDFPRPEGTARFDVQGANGLIDRLVTLGVIGPQEAGMARLGMGFLARATGDDAFETAVEVNAEGHVLVNGQRMR